MSRRSIRITGARQHNLRNIDVVIPRECLVVITGVSGSGKSSLAFDTIYAEGRRKYVESLSAHARQFLEQLQKPDVDRIEGLSPTIAIEQRSSAAGPRSTVATTTEIHDLLRVLFARVGEPFCWKCDRAMGRQSTSQVVDSVSDGPTGRRIMVLAPLVDAQRGAHKVVLERIVKEGFVRARVDGTVAMIEDLPALAPSRKHTIDVVVDRLVIKDGIAQRLADSIETATRLSGGRVLVAAEVSPGQWSDNAYSAALACPVHADVRIDELSPRLFSFNSPVGACPLCGGLGTTLEFDPDLIVPDRDLSLAAGAVAPWRRQGGRLNDLYARLIHDFCNRFNVLPDAAFRNIPEPLARILFHGTTADDEKRTGAKFEGIVPNLDRRFADTDSESVKQRLQSFMGEWPCRRCEGRRLRDVALCVKVAGRGIADMAAMTVEQAEAFFDSLEFSGEPRAVAEPLVSEIRRKLRFMNDVGVEYLTLDRASASLSAGEWQRIRLATQIGSGLVGVCYVLDEPTIGLHPRDTGRLAETLVSLAGMDNTVIVVEHDEQIIETADHMIDIGPGAGPEGGRLVAQGTVAEVLACEASITAKYLTGKLCVSVPEQRRPLDPDRFVEVAHATGHNLKDITVRFPLGCFVCVTGVSGSGKSTLVSQILLRALRRRIQGGGPRPAAFGELSGSEHIHKVVEIDQSPIGRTPRSTPATYVGVFGAIRQLYARTREARIRGYEPNRFSFNVKGGRCEGCQGQGIKRISMHFLPDVFVACDECSATRYNRETLEIRFRGKSIADILEMSVISATNFFESFNKIRKKLQALKDVGVGYIKLGQASNTLSGGEAQRVKLAAELGKDTEGHTLFVMDEPTTGLHFADVHYLIDVLNRLVDRGHTIIVIEHNLDVIKVADWIIDMGPEGGEQGGRVVVEGTPETVAGDPASHTGRFLTDRLAGIPPLGRIVSK